MNPTTEPKERFFQENELKRELKELENYQKKLADEKKSAKNTNNLNKNIQYPESWP